MLLGSHHLLDGNLPSARALLHYVLYKICITCHTKLRFVEYKDKHSEVFWLHHKKESTEKQTAYDLN